MLFLKCPCIKLLLCDLSVKQHKNCNCWEKYQTKYKSYLISLEGILFGFLVWAGQLIISERSCVAWNTAWHKPFHDFIIPVSLWWPLQSMGYCYSTNFKWHTFNYTITATSSGKFCFCSYSCCVINRRGLQSYNICNFIAYTKFQEAKFTNLFYSLEDTWRQGGFVETWTCQVSTSGANFQEFIIFLLSTCPIVLLLRLSCSN